MGSLFAPSKVNTSGTQTTKVEMPEWADTGLRAAGTRAVDMMYQPYQAYGGQRTAGMSEWTNGGAQAVGGAANFQPGQVAPGMLRDTNLQPYTDPFQQQVIDASMGDINRQTRQALTRQAGNGVMQAGFGGFGDRSAVANAEIERAGMDTAARTVAGLRSAGFQNAQSAAAGDITRGMQAQTANQQAGLQGAQLRAGAGATLAGLGEVERGVRQAGLDRQYEQFVEQRDDPFLKTQWAAGVINGTSAPLRGSSSSGSNTTPGPSLGGQLIGAGTAALGAYSMFKADGGRVGFAGGGLAEAPGYAGGGIPRLSLFDRFRAQGLGVPQRTENMPPLIDGVAEAVPMTDEYRPQPFGVSSGPEAAEPWRFGQGEEPMAQTGVSSGPEAAEPWRFGQGQEPNARAGEAEADVPALLARLRERWASAEPVPVRAAPPLDVQPIGVEVAPPAAMPAALDVPAEAAPSGGGDQRSWARRLADGMVDPENAGSMALLNAGLGMMASRNPSWLGAVGEGGMAGMQAARQLMPLAKERGDERALAGILAGAGTSTGAVAPRIPPRAGAARPGGEGGPSAPVVRTRGPGPAAAGGGDDMLDRLMQAESGGRADARNPRSTASGTFQFIDGTWRSFARARPDLFEGMSDEQVMAARNDPALSRQGAEWYRDQNTRDLNSAGLPVTGGTLALAHGFGPGGAAQLLRADPDAPVDQVMPAGVMRANPNLQGQTAGQVVASYERRFGGGRAGGGAAPQAAAAPRSAPAEEGGEAPVAAEPRVSIGGRDYSRADLLTMAARAPGNAAVQRFVGMALPILDRDVARVENLADRREARQQSADLRLALAGDRNGRQTPSDLGRLRQERDQLPDGHPDREAYDAAIQRASGVAAAERFTPAQIIGFRRDAANLARQEGAGLEFDREQDRTEWMTQRQRELLREWGVDAMAAGARGARGGGGETVRLAGGAGGGSFETDPRPDAVPDTGARIRPRGPQRVVPGRERERLMAAGSALEGITRLHSDWNDDYGGFMSDMVGNAAVALGRNTPGESPRANWWNEYQEMKNRVRHDLFGSALTATEKSEFDRANITPGMSAAAIADNLRRQREAANAAARKLGRSMIADGYNRRAIEEALGFAVPDGPLPAPPPPPSGGRAGAAPSASAARPGAAPPAGGGERPPLESFMR